MNALFSALKAMALMPVFASKQLLERGVTLEAVSYTHLTLPTIYSV